MVIDTRGSPYARLAPAPLNRVIINDMFWKPRIDSLIDKTLPLQYEFLEKTGRLDNFRTAGGKKGGAFIGLWFNDSDVYKWVEASAYALVQRWSRDLYEKLLNVVKDISDAQESDGYINTYVQLQKIDRWANLAWSHELYCGGHLIQAAIAIKRSLSNEVLFNTAIRFSNLLLETFGYGEKKLKTSDGHPEIELALVELYRETGRKDYLELAKFFIDIRGRGYVANTNKLGELYPMLRVSPVHIVDHAPIREMSDFAGSHAVRALYFFSGVADLYLEIGDLALWDALERLWNKAMKKIYITGGLGSRHDGESFGEDYELPNERSYSETCASVAWVMWAWRMFLASGVSTYMDAAERTLYNAALAGISIDGTRYFYVNPLADYHGKYLRQPWYDCACCPTNIIRLLSYIPSLIYSISRSRPEIWVNLFIGNKAEIDLHGNRVRVDMETNYPWDGKVVLKISPEKVDEFSLMIRIPEWADTARAKIRGKAIEAKPGSYLEIAGKWDVEELVELEIPLRPRLITAHPWIEADYGKLAIARGPLIYALEEIDNKFDIRNLVVRPEEINLREVHEPKLLDGIVAIEGEGYVVNEDELYSGKLYREYSGYRGKQAVLENRVIFRAIPYYAWNNRGRTRMGIWIKRI